MNSTEKPGLAMHREMHPIKLVNLYQTAGQQLTRPGLIVVAQWLRC